MEHFSRERRVCCRIAKELNGWVSDRTHGFDSDSELSSDQCLDSTGGSDLDSVSSDCLISDSGGQLILASMTSRFDCRNHPALKSGSHLDWNDR
jgi:hypothetical protein